MATGRADDQPECYRHPPSRGGDDEVIIELPELTNTLSPSRTFAFTGTGYLDRPLPAPQMGAYRPQKASYCPPIWLVPVRAMTVTDNSGTD